MKGLQHQVVKMKGLQNLSLWQGLNSFLSWVKVNQTFFS